MIQAWLTRLFQHEPAPPTDLRQQLMEGRTRILRQIEILQAGPASMGSGGAFIDNSENIAELRRVLEQVEARLAELEPPDR